MQNCKLCMVLLWIFQVIYFHVGLWIFYVKIYNFCDISYKLYNLQVNRLPSYYIVVIQALAQSHNQHYENQPKEL